MLEWTDLNLPPGVQEKLEEIGAALQDVGTFVFIPNEEA